MPTDMDPWRWGDHARAYSRTASALGRFAHVYGRGATGLGDSAYVHGERSTAVGMTATALGERNTALGYHALAAGQTLDSLGSHIECARDPLVAVRPQGFVSQCSRFLTAAETQDTRLAQDDSAGEAFRQTIQARLQGVLDDISTSRATAVGDASKATAEYSTALGSSAHAGGDRSTALGSSARANRRQRYRHRFGGYCGGERGGYRFDRPRLQIAGSRGLTDGEP